MNSGYRFVVLGILTLALTAAGISQNSLSDLMVRNERNPALARQAREVAQSSSLPGHMYLPEGILIEAMDVRNGTPLYGVMTNLAHPLEGGFIATYEELKSRYNLEEAIVSSGAIVLDRNWRKTTPNLVDGVLLVPNWSADNVMAFDPTTGDLLDTAYIHSISSALGSPKEARGTPWGDISVSDQITDLVQKFDSTGNYIGIFAPAGGVNTTILDNIRGHAYRPNGNLVVTVASGANAQAIAEFDSAGNYLGNFIANAAGGLNGPFGIQFRSSDVLVAQASSPTGVLQFDLTGTPIGQWASIPSFPEQITQLESGTIAVADFQGSQSGINLFTPTGTLIGILTGVTGNRGMYKLSNGHFLTTNAAGIHEIDSTTGSLIRTIATDGNLQYIDLFMPSGPVTSVGDKEDKPAAYSLLQNYPNPFNPGTNIGYQIAEEGFVTLKIYTVLGQEVASLVSEVQAPGTYAAPWNASDIAGGVYFYRLSVHPTSQAQGFTQVRKMVLMK